VRTFRYNAFGPWLKEKFGVTVYKVSVDGGFTCPNRDGIAGWGGCSYCSNESFRAPGADPALPIREQILGGIDYLSRRFRARKFLVYWQHYSNTYAPVEVLRQRYSEALWADSRIVGMTIGTRPDCIDREKLELIAEVAQGRFSCLEFGLESSRDDTLRRVNRGHDFACLKQAVALTRSLALPVCIHLILGFPWETRDEWLEQARVVNELDVQFIKLHHLHVVRGTRLAREYADSPFPLLSLEEWVMLVCDFLERLAPDIVVQRLFGWTPRQSLVGPNWDCSHAGIQRRIVDELERRGSRQGKLVAPPITEP